MTNSYDIKTTIAWERWKLYRDNFTDKAKLKVGLAKIRKYVDGDQYKVETGGAQPTINLCGQFVKTVSAKILSAPYRLQFVSVDSGADNQLMDDFYEYQMKSIDDSEFNLRTIETALTDGTAVVFTAYDDDTVGTKGKYRGFIKRELIPIERCFFENTKLDDVQDNKYLGYVFEMTVENARKIYKEEHKSEKEFFKLVRDDLIDANGNIQENSTSRDSDRLTAILMYERDNNGEVFFTLSTKAVELYKGKHPLNKEVAKEEIKLEKKESQLLDIEKTYPEKTTLPVTELNRDSDKKKFTRYPISIYAPEPIRGSFLGKSLVAPMIPNQNTINYGYCHLALIMSRVASPTMVAKEGALRGQVLTNEIGKIYIDHSPLGFQGKPIYTVEDGAKIDANMLGYINTLISMTKQVNGFDNLTSESFNSALSGFAYQQYTKQMNLPLENYLTRFRKYIKENARTDLMFFKFYGHDVLFYKIKTDVDMNVEENYKGMSEELNLAEAVENNQTEVEKLPAVKGIESRAITQDAFNYSWDVAITIEDGIAEGLANEGQHYETAMQYVGSQGVEVAKAFIEAHPAISRKTKLQFNKAIEEKETSEISMLRAQLEEAKQMALQAQEQLKQTAEYIKQMNMQAQAQQKAFNEQNETNKAYMSAALSEGEIKSLNARGISEEEYPEEDELIV